jgi:hypothetical protein
MDLQFDKGLVIQNGTFAIVSTDRDVLLSQLRQYVYVGRGEREMLPGYGLVSEPQQSNRSLGLIAERERLNISAYLPGVQVTATLVDGKNLQLGFASNDSRLEVRL